MPIFESIQRAEAAAEQMRNEATEAARKLLDATRQEIDAIVKKHSDDTTAEIRLIEAAAVKRAESEHERIIAAAAVADRQDEKNAAKRQEKALHAILKKVTGV